MVQLPKGWWFGRPLAAPRWAIFTLAVGAIAVAYFLAARLSLDLLASRDGVAVFWPAAGLASGILIGVGSVARWPVVVGVIAATLVANLLGDRNLWNSSFSAVANALEAVVVAGLIQHFYGPSFELNQLRRVVGLFSAAIVGTMVSGIVGTLGFVLFYRSAAPIPKIWFDWFASDALGTIAVAPLAIGLGSSMRDLPPRRELVEGGLALTATAALCAGMVLLPSEPWTFALAITTLSPLLVWIAARFRPGFTAGATFICTITIVWATTFAVGAFGDSRFPIEDRIVSAQATILAISFGALVLAALFSERRLHESAILERERRLEDALRAGGVMTFDWNLATGEIRHSQNAEKILGLESGQVLDGAEWLQQIHPDDRSQLRERLGCADPDKSSHTSTFRYLRRDDAGEVWLEQIAAIEFDSTGKPTRIHGLTTDITERKRFEEEISRARRSAELADRAKSSFLAAASHDLRQPLQTLRFLQGCLEQHHSHGEGRDLVADMGHSLDTMSGMLSSLLDLNQLESGNLRPSTSDFRINDIFESVATDFARLSQEKGLRWRMVRSAARVHSDKRMLEQVLRNLLSNAIRYTDRGGILLGCRRDGDRIRIEVWDSGVGIASAQLPHIFKEYYQGTEAAQRGGLGLGLAIVKRLADILDHRVDVRSTPNKGTAFLIEVPRAQGGVTPAESSSTPVDEGDFLPRQILVIEDETSIRSSVVRLLKLAEIDTVVAATGNEALALIGQQLCRPDLVLSDYNLPGSSNGVESIEALRVALGWNVPAIVMTGDTRSTTVDEIAAHDISVLIKPFLTDELLQQIRRLAAATAIES